MKCKSLVLCAILGLSQACGNSSSRESQLESIDDSSLLNYYVSDSVMRDSYQDFEQGQLAYASGQFLNAISHLSTAISKNDTFSRFYAWRTLAFQALGQNELALADIDEAISRNKYYYKHWLVRQGLLIKMGKLVEARAAKANRTLLEAYAASYKYMLYAQYDFSKLNYKSAMKYIDIAIAQHGDLPVYHLWKARIALQTGDISTAKTSFQAYKLAQASFDVKLK